METIEFMRFTIEEVEAGSAAGWTFASGWYPFQTSYWAWFSRPMADTEGTKWPAILES